MISNQQLKTANLIFTEHDKLKKESVLLNEHISLLNKDIKLLEESDSLKEIQFRAKVKELQKTINKKKRQVWMGRILDSALLTGLILIVFL